MKLSRRVAFGLLILGLVAGGGWWGCNDLPSPSDASASGDRRPPKAVLHLESFVVNLSDAEGGRFLRVGIDLGVDSPPASPAATPTARIRDTILAVLTTWRSDALLAPEGKQKLKTELLRGLRDKVPELNVRDVYFTDFLVQR